MMKKYIFKFTMLLLVLAGGISSCGKDDDLSFSNIENLYAQPLSVIQKCVQGKWEVKYTYGGVVGITPEYDKFVEIIGNKINGHEFHWKECTFQGVDGELHQTYAPILEGLEEPIFYFTSIKNDSLSVQLPLPIFSQL